MYVPTARKTHSKLFTFFVILAILAFVILFAGCSTNKVVAADPQASVAVQPVEEPSSDGIFTFGETVTWDDGVSLSVSKPTKYEPTDMAAGVVDGQDVVVFEMVLTNNSTEKLDPFVYNTASSGGEEASGVFDTSEDIGFAPNTALLPGKSIKWKEAYSVVDISDITLDVSTGIFDEAIFTN